MEQQLAERDMLMKQSFEESQRHAREAEELRASMMEQQMQMQADLARKAQEERRACSRPTPSHGCGAAHGDEEGRRGERRVYSGD